MSRGQTSSTASIQINHVRCRGYINNPRPRPRPRPSLSLLLPRPIHPVSLFSFTKLPSFTLNLVALTRLYPRASLRRRVAENHADQDCFLQGRRCRRRAQVWRACELPRCVSTECRNGRDPVLTRALHRYDQGCHHHPQRRKLSSRRIGAPNAPLRDAHC